MWEYKVIHLKEANEKIFNDLGFLGWELVGIEYRGSNGYFYLTIEPTYIFKRPKEYKNGNGEQ